MRIFLLKDVEKIGMAGELITVKDGFGKNYIIPRKLGIEVTEKNEPQFKQRVRQIEHRNEVISSKTSMLAEKIKSLKITVKRKTHDEGKLFGSINAAEIVDALAKHGISISKSQVIFGKSIKSTGNYSIKIKLSSNLQPELSLSVISL